MCGKGWVVERLHDGRTQVQRDGVRLAVESKLRRRRVKQRRAMCDKRRAHSQQCAALRPIVRRYRKPAATVRQRTSADEHGPCMAVDGGDPKTQFETSAFEKVDFEKAEESGTSAIDLSFTHSLEEMSPDALTVAMGHINDLCRSLELSGARGGAFLLVPAPGAATAHTARLVVPPEDFALCLPEPMRKPWFEKWAQGDPVDRAVRENLDPLPPVAHAA